MISVRNRHQPLNGNNLMVAAFLCCLFSCSTPEFVSGQKEIASPEKKQEQAIAPAAGETEVRDSVPELKKKLHKKDQYQISILLPFESDEVFITDLNETEGYAFPEVSQLATEYYQGCLVALDTLKKEGLNAKVIVRDIGMDTATLMRTLNTPEVASSDIIIGPLENRSLKIAADFSTAHKVWLVSPFSVTAISSTANPYYVLANATLQSHCEKICEHLIRTNLNRNVLLVHANQPDDLEIVNYFKNFKSSIEWTSNSGIRFTEISDSSAVKNTAIKNALSANERNIVVIASSDPYFVRSMIRQLNTLADDYDINVFGLPTWINFEFIPRDQFVNVSTYITQNFFLDKSSLAAEDFRKTYFAKFNVNPSVYAVKGYDQMMFFGSTLLSQGTDFEKAFRNINTSELAEQFSFKEVTSGDDSRKINYYENKSVFILKYETDKMEKLPY